MLLIASLLASASLLLPQDEGSAATTDTVRTFLQQAEAALYNPTGDGLQTLSFVVPITFPRDQLNEMMAPSGQKLPEGTPETLRLAHSSVTWEADGSPQLSGSVSDDFPPALAMMRAQIQGSLDRMGKQVLAVALNKMVEFGPLLENFDAAFDGAEGDDLRVLFTRKPGTVATVIPADSIVWLFDQDDNLPVGSQMSFSQKGPMGEMTMDLKTRFEWKPARGDDGALILSAMSATNSFGAMTMKQRTVYRHAEQQGVIMLTGYSETVSQEGPMAAPADMTKQVELEGLSVNSGARGAEG
ncbi:MAG: hypothetical protein DRQ55_06485 [Planctomycetota bacterium]|nr:MAG: hypothetical protein DRQ55_06485 [Planctomycetota bacterium]